MANKEKTEDKNNKSSSPSSGNSVIDSVIALNQIVLGSAAPTAMAGMQIAITHATGVGAQNFVASQQQMNVLGAAAVAAGAGNLLWEGLTRTVDKMTVEDRLKYWKEMMAISSGNPSAETEDQSSSDEKEGDASANDANDANEAGVDKAPAETTS
ncbi:MAG: RebB family R body protein [Sneathiellales bacterium]|nr:RebB family R body protein [Sneathiellales bacterium]